MKNRLLPIVSVITTLVLLVGVVTAAAAPKTMFIEAVSAWDWTKTPPLLGNSRAANSVTSFWGVIG